MYLLQAGGWHPFPVSLYSQKNKNQMVSKCQEEKADELNQQTAQGAAQAPGGSPRYNTHSVGPQDVLSLLRNPSHLLEA